MKGVTTIYPRQRLTYAQKSEDNFKWAKEMIDYIAFQHVGSYLWENRSGDSTDTDNEYERMLSNYQLYNNILNQKDFEKEFNPFNLQVGQFKDEIKPYNKTYNKIQVLLGEELKRPFDYRAVIVNDDGIRVKMVEREQLIEERLKQIIEAVYNMVQSKMSNTSGEQQSAEEQQAMQQEIQKIVDRFLSPEEIDRNLSMSFMHRKEKAVMKILKYLTLEQHLPDKKNDTFKHALISGKEFTWVGIENNAPVAKPLNSLGVIYEMSPDVK